MPYRPHATPCSCHAPGWGTADGPYTPKLIGLQGRRLESGRGVIRTVDRADRRLRRRARAKSKAGPSGPSGVRPPVRQLCASPDLDAPGPSPRRRRPSFSAVAGAPEVLAGSPIHGDLQAHLAVARVAEQPPASTAASLMLGTKGSRLGTALPRPARDCSVSSIGEEIGVLWLVPARTMRATAAECLLPVTSMRSASTFVTAE